MDQDIPELVDEEHNDACANGASGSDDDDDFYEVDMGMEAVQCLFCEEQLPCVEKGLEHLKQGHSVDFQILKSKFHMDQYAFIKLINCIRCEEVPAKKVLAADIPFWNDEKYLKAREYEAWLSYDYDEMPRAAVIDHDGATKNDLLSTIKSLQEKVKEQELLLEQAREDMTKMRVSFQRLLDNEPTPTTNERNRKLKAPNSVASLSLEADSSYFSSYAHFGIHHEMLSDVVRTTSYRDALILNKEYVHGKDVLDVGCGTSILSIFASQAGAKSVVGIDNSDIIYSAMDIVKRNNINNVTLVKGRLEDTNLPQEKFDIIISEWMGYFLLFEGMLDSVIYARDTHLKPDGILLPNRCTMSIVGYGSESLYKDQVTYWDNVYGLNMSNMRKEVLHEPLIDVVDAGHILTEANIVADLNLLKVDLNYSNFTYSFDLKCIKSGELSAFVGYFDTFFDLPVPVMFSTSPNSKPTHWKQVVFFLEKTQKIAVGDTVKGIIVCRRSRNSARSLDITIESFGNKCTYYLD
uniref:type I protein arginine methyltransferase n=1 Tax=Zeugodacus cucurbitae TaxID=28588 RepID=A0A0A1WYI9_ZEUCU